MIKFTQLKEALKKKPCPNCDYESCQCGLQMEAVAPKDASEYDYEGDMAMTKLRTIMRNAKDLHDLMEPNTNLPEWVQSKITLANDYIQTAADYLKSEDIKEARSPLDQFRNETPEQKRAREEKKAKWEAAFQKTKEKIDQAFSPENIKKMKDEVQAAREKEMGNK